MSTATGTLDTEAAPRPSVLKRLYRGETSFDFVGRRRWWFALSAIVIVAGLGSLGTRGLNFGIDFKGGSSWTVVDNGASVATVQNAVTKAGLNGATVQVLGKGSSAQVQVEADLNSLSQTRQTTITNKVDAVMSRIGHVQPSKVSFTNVGPTWGSQITDKAIIAVIVFFCVIVAYISVRFEWKMAIAALLAVIHDLLVVVGVFSLSGFQVTSDTVIAVLTILGYSLYDTVVVFDRVADNTRGLGASGRMTYEDVVNLSMNQTLARSINTSLVAILPVLSVLVIGAQILGATTLQYFGLALVVGLLSGAYSSIFIASPVLAMMKEREARYVSIRQKLANRADRTGLLTPRAAALLTATSAGGVSRPGPRPSKAAAKGRSAQARKAAVLRPGAANAAKSARTAVTQTESVEDFDEAASNGSGDGKAAPQRAAGAAKRPAAASSQPGRPAPRPRKGKGTRKGRRR
ncbi:MAG: protein translocase subunit SecF [Acidimicrobiales bacterium]